MNLRVYILCIFIFSLLSCSKEEDCSNIAQQVFLLDNVDECFIETQDLQELTNPFLLINDEKDILISEACNLNVDFSSNSILLGSIALNGALEKADYSLEYSCEDNSNYLYISYEVNKNAAEEMVHFTLILPKITDEEALKISTAIL